MTQQFVNVSVSASPQRSSHIAMPGEDDCEQLESRASNQCQESVGNESDDDTQPLLALNLTKEFLRSKSWRGWYRNQHLERYFLLFTATHRLAASVLGVVFGLGMLGNQVIRWNAYNIWFSITRVTLIVIMILAGVIHYFQCVRHNRSIEVIFHTAVNLKGAVRTAKRHEQLSCVIFLSIALLFITVYPFAAQCIEELNALNHPAATARRYCNRELNTYPNLVQLFIVFIVRVRAVFAIPLLLVPLLSNYVPRIWISDVDTSAEFIFAIISSATVTAILGAIIISMERSNRKRYEAATTLRQLALVEEIHRRMVEETLSSLIPSLAKLTAHEPVVDMEPHCLVSVCCIHDFAHWSSEVLPDIVFSAVEMLFGYFDEKSVHFGVDKLATVGDYYVASTNLRRETVVEGEFTPEHDASSGDKENPDSQNTNFASRLFSFAMQQMRGIRKANRLGATHDIPPLAGKLAIHCGSVLGTIVGAHTLSYAVVGSGIDTAFEMVRCAPAATAIASCVAADRCKSETTDFFFLGLSDAVVPRTLQKLRISRVYGDHQVIAESPRNARRLTSSAVQLTEIKPPTFRKTNPDSSSTAATQQRYEFLRGELERKRMAAEVHAVLTASVQRSSRQVQDEVYDPRWEHDQDGSLAAHTEVRSTSEPSEVTCSLERSAFLLVENEESIDLVGWPWRRFASERIEWEFRQFHFHTSHNSSAKRAVVFGMFLLCVLTLLVVELGGHQSTWSLVLTITAIVSCALRLGFTIIGRHPIGRAVGIGMVPVAILLILAGFFADPYSIMGGRLFIGNAVLGLIVFDGFRYRPFISFVVANVVNGVAMACFTMRFSFEAMVPVFLVLASVLSYLPSFINEVQSRHYFQALLLARGARLTAQREVRYYETVLEMLVPKPLIRAMLGKMEGGVHPTSCAQWLGNVCVAKVRIGCLSRIDLAAPSSSHTIRSTLALLDDVDRIISKRSGLLEKFHAIGDGFSLVGPVLEAPPDQIDRQVQEAGVSHHLQLPLLHLDTNGDLGVHSGLAMLDVVLELGALCGKEAITAVLACDSGFAGVVGTSRPTFELLGAAFRSAATVFDAAPEGSHLALTSFTRLMESGRITLPRFPGDFHLEAVEYPWAVRGAGLVRLSRLRRRE